MAAFVIIASSLGPDGRLPMVVSYAPFLMFWYFTGSIYLKIPCKP